MTAERTEIERELERSNRELRTFRRLSKIGLTTPLDGTTLGSMLEVICEETGLPLAALELYDAAGEMMRLAAHLGFAEEGARDLEWTADGSVSGQVARFGVHFVEARDREGGPSSGAARRFAARTFVCVPMKAEGRVLGALSLGCPEELAIDQRFVDWVADLAGHVAAITERKRTAQALHENAARLRLLIEQMPALVWTTDSDLRFTSSQGAGLAAIGLQAGEVDGRLVPEFSEAGISVAAHRRVLEGESVSFQGRLRGRMFEAHVEPLRDGSGAIVGCIGVALDVTSRHEAEEELRGITDTLHALVEASPLAILTLDLESRVTSWSPAAERTFGWKAEEVLGRRLPFVPDDKWDEHISLRDRVLAGELFTGLETRRLDTSDRKRAEQAIRRLASVPEPSPEPLVELDLAGNTLYVNQAARNRFPDLQALGSWHPVLAHVASVLPRFRHGEKRSFSFEVSHEQSVYHQMVYYVPDSLLVRVFLHDLTEQHRAKELLRRETLYDRLTELPNRAAFLQQLGVRIEQGDAGFSVLSLNLDRFKVVNDSLGQGAGDQLLASIAQRISACLGPGGTAARLGSDEFAVLLREADAAGSLELAASLREAIGRPLEIARQEIFPSVSIGVVAGERHEDAESVLRDAHIAMYRAKSLGGGRCEVFDPAMGSRSLDRLRLENELRRAIERSELEMHYQPIVRLADGAVTAFEALLRWPRRDRGDAIPPADFVAVAEESGLILPLSYWTLGQACQWLRDGGEEGPALHLNVSGRLFSDFTLADRVQEALAENRVRGERLVLEITESVLMDDAEAAVGILARIKALGVGLAVDDFGTGYSSLSYLQRFPIDHLKIDRSFLASLGGPGENHEILRAILTLARGLGIEVIAEGVETEDQLDRLLTLGCDLAQGYLFALPMDRETARALLAAPPSWIGLIERSAASPVNVTPLRRPAVS
ncbi:MAG TPA: EAL domain-containing protein [Thermoanaerobaculia bacterium]|jgi:diguanylate cyclase (GGDEF)-like protein/PAS domain S-box-containing protein|nr:EAL domain-containing protein [Thermoanaerobaculia bacterium]